MSTSSQNESPRIPDAPMMTLEARDPDIGLEAWVCIHSVGRYGSSGGMRCLPDVTREEVQILARAMTFKYSFFKVGQGGAKAGIRIKADESREVKVRLLQEAARHFEPLIRGNVWSPWTDMSFFRPDLVDFYAGIGITFPPKVEGGSSFRTALSANAALEAVLPHMQLDPRQARVALEGFGSVAEFLAPFFQRGGIKLIAASTVAGAVHNPKGLDLDAVLALRRRCGDRWVREAGPWSTISKDELFQIPCEVLIPCARVHSIDEHRAANVAARLVLPIANTPCTTAALEVFDQRGIIYLPDYIVNGGGACGHALGGASPQRLDAAEPFLEPFRRMVRRLLAAGERRRSPVRRLADEVAHRSFPSLREGLYEDLPLGRRVLRKLQQMHALPGDDHAKEERGRIRKTIEHLESLFPNDAN